MGKNKTKQKKKLEYAVSKMYNFPVASNGSTEEAPEVLQKRKKQKTTKLGVWLAKKQILKLVPMAARKTAAMVVL